MDTTNDAQSIGANIRKLRRDRDMTQATLADLMGTTVAMISNYERGQHMPSASVVKRLSEHLKCFTDQILAY